MSGSSCFPLYPLLSLYEVYVMKQKQIMLLRHAQAEASSHGGDFGRKLTENGRNHVKALTQKLLELKLLPQVIISSTAQRAVETSEIVCQLLAIDSEQILYRDELYHADVGTFLSQLHRLNNRFKRVLIVAHNPALEDLVDFLSTAEFDNEQPSGKRMLPATLLMLEFEGKWEDLRAHCCGVTLRQHGKDLIT